MCFTEFSTTSMALYFILIAIVILASDSANGLLTKNESSLISVTGDVNGKKMYSVLTNHESDQLVGYGQSVSLITSEDSTPQETVGNTTCLATWFLPKLSSNGSISCKCGSELGDVINCHESTERIDLLRGFCMTFSVDDSRLVVGPCIYGDIKGNGYNPYYHLPSNSSELQELCGQFHRRGQLCGKCEDGFALPVYSYELTCVECERDYAQNWVKYAAASFCPLTLFFIVIVTFRVRITSGLMSGFILISQIGSAPSLSRGYLLPYRIGNRTNIQAPIAPRIIVSLYGIWNLDFFRLLYPPFCLHPNLTTVQMLAMDYIIAVYPLVLIVVAYLLVKLHDCGFKLIVWLWRPFHRYFVRFRRGWNVKTSLIDAFATFLLLSYFKFLSVSMDLLTPIQLFNVRGDTLNKHYLYWDGTIEYFGNEHLPYAILAVVVLVLFNMFPLLLMCLYPRRWFHQCLNTCRLHSQVLHTFMDAFQGCYKDGANGGCDCRWFAGLYMLTQMLFLAMQAVVTSQFWLPVIASVILVLFLLTALFQPYKSPAHNRINIFLVFVMMLLLISSMANLIAYSSDIQFHKPSDTVGSLISLIPLMYIVGVILYKLFAHRACVRGLCRNKLCSEVFRCCKEAEDDFTRQLPERMVDTDIEETASLLAEVP